MRRQPPTTHPVLAVAIATLLAAAGLVTGLPSSADACTPARCQGGFASIGDGPVPVGLKRFIWRPKLDRTVADSEVPTDLDAKIVDAQTGASKAISTEYLGNRRFRVHIGDRLTPGRRYEFLAENRCQNTDPEFTTTFEVNGAEQRPSSTGDISAGSLRFGPVRVVAHGGSCGFPSDDVDAAYRYVRTPITESMEPWRGVWETSVDVRKHGEQDFQTWNPPSSVHQVTNSETNAVDTTLVTACEEPENGYVVASLDPGRYEVRFELSLPGTEWELQTDTTTVRMGCSPTQSADEIDSFPHHDVGPDAYDPLVDTGDDTGNGAVWGSEQNRDGCGGCSSTGSAPLSPSLLVAALLVGLASLRRRFRD